MIRVVIVLLVLGVLGFGTGALGRISNRAHVWPIGLSFHPLISVVAIGGAIGSSRSADFSVDGTCSAAVIVRRV